MIEFVDIVNDCQFGDCGKGKIVSQLSKDYDLCFRFNGSNNAGHTVVINNKQYKTNLVPSGVFHNIPGLIGPGCALNVEAFYQELEYLKSNGIDASNVFVHPHCHIITDEHIKRDKEEFAKKLGTTSKGVGPCYSDKYLRTGLQAKNILPKELLWNQELKGKLLGEAAQGYWLDIDQSINYPYVTSSNTLPYAACSIGFAPQYIRRIFSALKPYETRSGEDPDFPDSLLNDPVLSRLGDIGKEYGTVTKRRRKTNWLNLDNLIKAINVSGTTHAIFNKCDVIQELNVFKLFHNDSLQEFESWADMSIYIKQLITSACPFVQEVIWSYSPETI